MSRVIILTFFFLIIGFSGTAKAELLHETYKFGDKKGQAKLSYVQKQDLQFQQILDELKKISAALEKNNEAITGDQNKSNTERLMKALSTIAGLISEGNKTNARLLKIVEGPDKENAANTK